MTVIFLDFDGVLNSRRFLQQHSSSGVALDPQCMTWLRRLVDVTGAQIVLTTSWREHWEKDSSRCDEIGTEINHIFAEFHLSILDKTPSLVTGRESEILQWLAEHPSVKQFAILDDCRIVSGTLVDRFVCTSAWKRGFSEEEFALAVAILKE